MSKRVLIVGGGLGGLAAAYELNRNEFQVSLFEARQAVGGRTRSRTDILPPFTLELGAEFVGGNHPRWLAYAKEFGIGLSEIDWPATAWVQLDGQIFSGQQLAHLKTECHRLALQITEFAALVNDEQPWLTPHAEELDRISLADAVFDRIEGDNAAKRLLLLKFHQSEAGDPRSISWLGQLAVIKGHGLADYWEETEKLRCPEGVEQLAKALEMRLPTGAIQTEAVASRIEIGKSTVALELANGEQHKGDWLILAVPPSQWSRIAIDPPLPKIPGIKVGAASKEFVRVTKPFWAPDPAPLASSEHPQGTFMQTGTDLGPNGKACLEWFVAGTPAETLVELSPAQRQKRLQDLVNPIYPTLKDHWEECVVHDWVNEPFAGGGYSYAQLGKATTWGPTLYNGLGRLKFVGEHASFRFTGYMEGALETAARAVSSILNSRS